jgi:hypothetical protein
MLSSNLVSSRAKFLIDWRNFESSDTEIAEEKIPINTKYEDSPRKEVVVNPNGGKGHIRKN